MKSNPQPRSTQDWQQLHRTHVTELRRRYDELFQGVPNLDAIVIHSGYSALKYSRDDQHWPTAATPHFIHWTPYVAGPAMLVVTPGVAPQLFIERHQSYWDGPGPENRCWDQNSFKISEVDDLKKVELPKDHVYVGDNLTYRTSHARRDQHEGEVLAAMDATRTSKTEFEVASIRSATSIALQGHRRLAEIFLSGEAVSELQLQYEYLLTTEQLDQSVPYGNIIGIGEHANILHHVHYDRTKRSGDIALLVDAGATCNGYASDITRTYVRGTGPTAKHFAAILDGMDELQQQLCKKFVIGTDYQTLHNEAHKYIADLLIRSKLTTASVDELVDSGATRRLFPHGLGHSLGIQVHDVGMKLRKSSSDNPYLRNTSIISKGHVVTIEPGLYFIPSLLNELKALPVGKTFDWNLLHELRLFGGIRIEDNMLATEAGPVNLTREICS